MEDQQPQTEQTPGEGHNSGKSGIAADRLRAFVERIERLEEEKAALAKDIREVYAESKGAGFDAKTLRHVVRLRKLDRAERQEQEALLDLYKDALGMLDGTPLGDAALVRAGADTDGADTAAMVMSGKTMRIHGGPEEPIDAEKLIKTIETDLRGSQRGARA